MSFSTGWLVVDLVKKKVKKVVRKEAIEEGRSGS